MTNCLEFTRGNNSFPAVESAAALGVRIGDDRQVSAR
jgi:hypothetical protein